MDESVVSEQQRSLEYQIGNGDLWCLRTLLENGFTTIDMLRKAVLNMDKYMGNEDIHMPLLDFLLDVFESEPDVVRMLLDRFNWVELFDVPESFAERIFKYEHNGSVRSSLIIHLPLESFIEYTQLKKINIKQILRNHCEKNSKVITWIAENIPLDSPKDLMKLRVGWHGMDFAVSLMLLERLCREFLGHPDAEKMIERVLNSIFYSSGSRSDRHTKAIESSLELIRDNGYIITDISQAGYLLSFLKVNNSLARSVIDARILEKIDAEVQKEIDVVCSGSQAN